AVDLVAPPSLARPPTASRNTPAAARTSLRLTAFPSRCLALRQTQHDECIPVPERTVHGRPWRRSARPQRWSAAIIHTGQSRFRSLELIGPIDISLRTDHRLSHS